MYLAEIIEGITDYRRKGRGWLRLADLIYQVSRTDGWVGKYKSNADWLKAAAEMSGYGPTVIRRMLRVRSFLERMVEHKGFTLPEGTDIPLASLEILERMFPLAPERATELLEKAVKGEITLRAIQNEYDMLTSRRSEHELHIKSVVSFELQAYQVVCNHVSIFGGNGDNKVIRNVSSSILQSDLVLISSSTDRGKLYIGFEFKLSSVKTVASKECFKLISRVTYLSEFFDIFWIILSGEYGSEYGTWLIGALETLQLNNVGVAVLRNLSEDSAHKLNFPGSVVRLPVATPAEAGREEKEYIPRRKHLLIDSIGSLTTEY